MKTKFFNEFVERIIRRLQSSEEGLIEEFCIKSRLIAKNAQ